MTTRVLVYEHLSGVASSRADEAMLAQGLAMRNAMAQDLARAAQAADCSVSAAVCEPGNTLPCGVVPLRARAGESAFDFVARHSLRHDLVWLVAPETDGVLARFQRAVGDARWMGCSAQAIALASRKTATLAHLAAHGVPTPLACSGAPDATRWVVKPDDGAGAVATQVHRRHDEALADRARRAQAGMAATLEPWIEGEALSLSLLCAPHDAELLSVNRQRIAIDAQGRVSFDGVHIDALPHDDARWRPLAELARQVTRAIPGLRGFVGVDLVWHARRGPVVIEVNPRVTCAYVGLSAALRRNLGAELLAANRPPGGHRNRDPAHADG